MTRLHAVNNDLTTHDYFTDRTWQCTNEMGGGACTKGHFNHIYEVQHNNTANHSDLIVPATGVWQL